MDQLLAAIEREMKAKSDELETSELPPALKPETTDMPNMEMLKGEEFPALFEASDSIFPSPNPLALTLLQAALTLNASLISSSSSVSSTSSSTQQQQPKEDSVSSSEAADDVDSGTPRQMLLHPGPSLFSAPSTTPFLEPLVQQLCAVQPLFAMSLFGAPPASSAAASSASGSSSSPKPLPHCSNSEGGENGIVPSSDKEGWCRNKKYIEKVANGFMCTVCKKVYGRYNSVSYHVTIYHRNPPIRCEHPNCNFTTREARYIHFHKYYRHHIPLPDSIDLNSRKCPFCRHVSKSPAMLEKHIARHVPGERTPRSSPASAHPSPPTLPPTPAAPLSLPSSFFFFSQPPEAAAMPALVCSQCNFQANSVLDLSQHISISHDAVMFTKCTLCDFESNDTNSLLLHIAACHKRT